MKKFIRLLVCIMIAAAVGLTFFGCQNGNDDDNGDQTPKTDFELMSAALEKTNALESVKIEFTTLMELSTGGSMELAYVITSAKQGLEFHAAGTSKVVIMPGMEIDTEMEMWGKDGKVYTIAGEQKTYIEQPYSDMTGTHLALEEEQLADFVKDGNVYTFKISAADAAAALGEGLDGTLGEDSYIEFEITQNDAGYITKMVYSMLVSQGNDTMQMDMEYTFSLFGEAEEIEFPDFTEFEEQVQY